MLSPHWYLEYIVNSISLRLCTLIASSSFLWIVVNAITDFLYKRHNTHSAITSSTYAFTNCICYIASVTPVPMICIGMKRICFHISGIVCIYVPAALKPVNCWSVSMQCLSANIRAGKCIASIDSGVYLLNFFWWQRNLDDSGWCFHFLACIHNFKIND